MTENKESHSNPTPDAAAVGLQSTAQLSTEEIDLLVADYLKSRNYTKALKYLESESSLDTKSKNKYSSQFNLTTLSLQTLLDNHRRMLHSIYNYTHSSQSPQWYLTNYDFLHLWIHQCLDMYRLELQPILYPLFVHILFTLLLKNRTTEAECFFHKYSIEHDALHSDDLHTLSQFLKNIAAISDVSSSNHTKVSTNKHNTQSSSAAGGTASGGGNGGSGDTADDNGTVTSSSVGTASASVAEEKSDDTVGNAAVRVNIAILQMRKHPIFNRYRKNKFEISVSRISHNLLMSWLHSCDLDILIQLINDYIHFRIIRHEPKSMDVSSNNSNNVSSSTVQPLGSAVSAAANENNNKDENDNSGDTTQQIAAVNRKEVNCGILRQLHRIEAQALRERSSKLLSKSGMSGGEPPLKKQRTLFSDLSDSQPKITKEFERITYNEIRNRVYAGPDRLPSVCIYTFLNSHNSICSTKVSTDGRWIVAGCNDSTIRLFDVARATSQSLIAAAEQQGTTVVTSSSNPLKKDGTKNKMTTSVTGDTGIKSDKMEVDGDNTTNSDDFIEKSPSEEAAAMERNCHTLIGHKSPVYSLSFSPDRDTFLSASADTTVRLWSCDKQECLAWYRGHIFPIWDVQFSPLALYFATASNDRTARLWSTEKVVPLRIFAGHLSDVDVVRFHPNCNYILTGSSDRTIRMWDVQSGKCVRILSGHTHKINDIKITGDGTAAVSASSDGTIRVWDIGSGQSFAQCNGHTNEVTHITLANPIQPQSISFEPLSTTESRIQSFPLIVSAGLDNTVRFWDINNWNSEVTKNNNSLLKTINNGNVRISHLETTRSNLVMTSGVQL